MTLIALVAAWVAGILVASTTDASISLWAGLAIGAFVLAAWARHARYWRLLWLCIALCSLGAGRYAWANRTLPDHHIAHYVDSGYVTLTGIIAQDADVRDQHVNLRVQVETLQQRNVTISAEGLVLVQAPRFGDYTYGNRVRVSGALLTPPEFDDFSYRDYLARRGIHAMIPNADIETLGHDKGSPWYAAMYDLKARAQRTIDRILPSPQAPLLNGILIGVETGISADVREAFNATGTSHVIAISGANIIVVIRVLMGLFTPSLGTRRASLITIAGIACYTVFVGADAAVVRAAIMGSLAMFTPYLGQQAHLPRARKTYGLTAIAFAVWLMTAANPNTLWDIGFQLSVAATAGLILFGDYFEGQLKKLLRIGFAHHTARSLTRMLAEPITVSLAAQITTTPLILVYFGRLSLISLLANILIVPVQAYIMTLGWLAVLLGLIWLPAGEVAAWIVWLPLTYTLKIARALGRVEWAAIDVEFSDTNTWAVYGALVLLALVIMQHREDRSILWRAIRQRITTLTMISATIVVTLLVWIMAFSQPDGKLHVWFLDVGHGHAALLRTPNGTHILIDGGPNPTQLRRAVGDELSFWNKTLDMVIVTQPKASAIGALPALLDNYDVTLMLTNGHNVDAESYQALVAAWEKHHIAVQPVTAGYTITTGDGVLIEVLHPQTAPVPNDKVDDMAMVLRVSYGNTAFLITPDLSPAAEDALFNAGWYAGSTVLELPAFGDEAANTTVFLTAINPQVAVVSVGAGNRSGLPDAETVARLGHITPHTLYRTDHHGTIECVTDGQTLNIFTQR